jgi:hypothetical protein
MGGEDMNEQIQAALVKVRETIGLAIDGQAVDLRGAAVEINRAIKALCPHDPGSNWDSRSDEHGQIITTCERCGISWYEHVE